MPRPSPVGTGSRPVAVTSRPRATSSASGVRPTNEYRPQRSPPSTDSSRKPGPSPTTLAKAATGVSVSATISPHTGTMRCSAASSANSAGLGRSRSPDVATSFTLPGRSGRRHSRSPAERPVEARPLLRVARAVPVLVDEDDERVAVAVEADLPDVLPVAGRLALAPELLPAPAPEPRPAGRQRPPQRRLVHVRHHQHVAAGRVLDDRHDQAPVVELDLRQQRLVDLRQRDHGGEGVRRHR